jgi:hypothetical protein
MPAPLPEAYDAEFQHIGPFRCHLREACAWSGRNLMALAGGGSFCEATEIATGLPTHVFNRP